MADREFNNFLRRWADVANRSNGYASQFNYLTAAEKAIVELSTVQEWCTTIKCQTGIDLKLARNNPHEPPDCLVNLHNKILGVELVQLVEERHMKRAVAGETPYEGQLFRDTQWTCQRFKRKLSETIQSKARKYEKRNLKIDVLLVHTDEPWLTSALASMWLKEFDLTPSAFIRSAYLIFTYEPAHSEKHWPVMKLFGDQIEAL